jgi:phosphoglycolate phosphatase-like HAD superfamily hydrolase
VLVTATPQEEIESILERLQIRHCFRRVFGAPVAKATGMLQRLTDLGMDPQLALMIGDSREDFAAAQRCRVPFLLRRTPENARSMPDYSGPHIADFEQP